MRGFASGKAVLALALAAGVAIGLTGCGGGEPMPTPEQTSAAPSVGPTTPPEPEIDLSGTANENLPYFDQVNVATVAAGGREGRAFIDGLVAAGYSKETMELTPDRTSINAQADTFQFSVRLNGTCLLGQYGGTGYESSTAQTLGDGRCLIGTTRPIDW